MNGTEPMKKGKIKSRGPRRFVGMGRSLDSPPLGDAAKYLVGDNSDEGIDPHSPPSGKHSPVNPDAGYGKGSSVVGPCSKTFV